MRKHKNAIISLLFVSVAVFAVLHLKQVEMQAQAVKPAPRLANGKPDFTGVWDHPRVGDITKNVDGLCAGGSLGCKQVGSGEVSFTAEGKAVFEKNNRPTTFDYGEHCLPWGFVRSFGTPYPHAYVHNPARLAILWEQDNAYHMVPTDGRDLPRDLEPSWRGTSVGKWEGDTLVIQTAGFNGESWLDTTEHPLSDQLHTTIRMTRPDYDHLSWEITIEDPKYYTKPLKNVRTFVLMKPGEELYEYSCTENNRCEGGRCTPADVQK